MKKNLNKHNIERGGDVKRRIGIVLGGILLVIGLTTIFHFTKMKTETIKEVNGTVLSVNDEYVIVQDAENVTYQFKIEDFLLNVGDGVAIQYTGLLDADRSIQDISIKSYSKTKSSKAKNEDMGIFKDYYAFAEQKVKTMSLDEQIGQLLLVQLPADFEEAKEALSKNQFAGYLLFKRDFENKTKNEVIDMIKDLQKEAKIPLLIAVDEEGGSVVRVSSNTNLRDSKFLSPREIYQTGGMEAFKLDTANKSEFLGSLGINLNLAPVVDVSTDPSNYIYPRALGENTELTKEFAKTVIEASKGGAVSYTLKHFPGYGNNADTHTGIVHDYRTYESIENNDLPPFKAGIDAGAEAVLVNHNIVENIDSTSPASLSIPIHNLLKNDLGFTGVIITDDLSMDAIDSIDNATTKALLAGNDLMIVSDYYGSIGEVKSALQDGTISENLIQERATKILAWKYYKGLLYENQK